MRTLPRLPQGTFNQLFEELVVRKGLKEILQAYGPAKRRPPKLKATELVKGLVFHVLQGAGKLSENMKRSTGKRVSDSALSQRRQVMGLEVFEWIMEGALEVRANARKHPEAFYHGLRLIGVDGTRFSVSNSPQIVKEMSKAVSRRMKAAFAKINVCVMVELGLRNPIAASIGLKNESEMELGREVLQSMPEESLLIGDRLYGVGVVIEEIADILHGKNRHVLLRVKSNLNSQVLERYEDGSALVEIKTRAGRRLLREVRGSVRRASGKWVAVRLWTSLLDWRQHPAGELMELYGRRWEHEIFYKELKVELRGADLLNSHTPETAGQEVAALILAYSILSAQRMEVAALGDVEVLRISFGKTLAVIKPLWVLLSYGKGVMKPAQIRTMVRRAMKDIAECAIPPRRKRSCPRAVRQPVCSWPRLLKNSYQNGPVEVKISTVTQ